MPAWEARLARVTQGLMYLLLVAMPLSGLAGSQFSEDGMSFFGHSLPRLVPASHDLAERLFDLHGTLIWLLVALVALHVLGALKHLWLHKDGVFQRMAQAPGNAHRTPRHATRPGPLRAAQTA